MALGPIYETRLKAMKWAPQGLERIADWKKRIGALPLVAIGGITPERADGVLAAGRRQRGRHHRLLHPCRSRGARARVAGLGGAHAGLSVEKWRGIRVTHGIIAGGL